MIAAQRRKLRRELKQGPKKKTELHSQQAFCLHNHKSDTCGPALQIAALKEELNKEIELNSELRTEASRQQQTMFLAIGAAIAAAITAASLLYRRR